jgi:hypothetical protein
LFTGYFLFGTPVVEKCSITIALKLYFRICQQEGPRQQRGIGIEWNTSASGLMMLIYWVKT